MDSIWILLLLLVLVIIIIYMKYRNHGVIYVKSYIDGEYYLVRDLHDKQQASNLLATIKQNIMTLTNYLYENRDTKYTEYRSYINQLHDRIQNVVIMESSGDSVYTSYSINKGEQIVFCLRSRHIKDELHKLNLLMYVVLHEMSHVACPELGHTDLFKKIFAFITTVAIEIGMYTKIEFSFDPVEYCGLMITDSIV
jgi:predicted metal-dependent hydrolase